MANELSKRDKGRFAQWLVVIEFSLAALRDELDASGVSTVEITDELTRVDIALAAFRQRLGIE